MGLEHGMDARFVALQQALVHYQQRLAVLQEGGDEAMLDEAAFRQAVAAWEQVLAYARRRDTMASSIRRSP